jgi:hypothetical protein
MKHGSIRFMGDVREFEKASLRKPTELFFRSSLGSI